MTDSYRLTEIPRFLRDEALTEENSRHKTLLTEAARIIESHPINMGHFDTIIGALANATKCLTDGAQTREWDSLQAAMGEAWADIQRAVGYAVTLRSRVPEGHGFSDEL